MTNGRGSDGSGNAGRGRSDRSDRSDRADRNDRSAPGDRKGAPRAGADRGRSGPSGGKARGDERGARAGGREGGGGKPARSDEPRARRSDAAASTDAPKRQKTRGRPPPAIERKGRPDAPAEPRRGDLPKRVGGPRNEFGTRIARRVVCSRCQREDHVPFVPKDQTKALCRDCAAEVLKTYEHGVKVRVPTRPEICNLCGTPFDLPVSAVEDDDPLCRNCLLGFTTWRGSVDVPHEEREQVSLEPRRAGTVLRKRSER